LRQASAPPATAGFKPPAILPGRITRLGEIFADFYYILQGGGVNQEKSFRLDNLTLRKKSGNRPPSLPDDFLGLNPPKTCRPLTKPVSKQS
jgi:hypothetical protein